jgi:ABC-2 type transport system permease protein
VIRLVRVEMLKLRSTRMWLGLLLGAVLLVALGAIATLILSGRADAAKQGLTPIRTVQDVRDLVYTAGIVGVFTLILGATSMTTEYRSGTIAGTFLATPNRWPVVAAKVLGSAATGFAFGVIAALIPIVSAVVYFLVKGQHILLGRPVLDAALVVCVIGAYSAAIGAGVGAAIRSQLVAILSVLAWSLVAEPLIGSLIHSVQKWLPIEGAHGALTQQTSGLLSPVGGGALMVAYVLLALAVGIFVTRARDVA